jgi:hypothetical protein
MSEPWKPSNPDRWVQLGLADSKPDARLPEQGSTADLLAWALTLPGAVDPIEGLIEGARLELSALADIAPTPAIAAAINFIVRRLDVAALLLARCDNRVPPPPEYDPDAAEAPAPGEQEPPAAPPPAPKAPSAPKRRGR